MALEPKTLAILDLETTSLPSRNKTVKITELCIWACPINSPKQWRLIDKLLLQINPGITKIEETPSMLTNLTNDDLKVKQPFDASTTELIKLFLKRQQTPILLIAHNGAYFDFPILMQHFENDSLDMEIYCCDSLHTFRNCIERPRLGYGLSSIYSHFFNQNIPNAHTAEADVYALLMCVLRVPNFLTTVKEFCLNHNFKRYVTTNKN